MPRALLRLACCALFLATLGGLHATSTTFTWTGAIDSNFNTLGNWTVDGTTATVAPTTDDTLLFGAVTRTTVPVSAAGFAARIVVGESGSSEPLTYVFGSTTTSLTLAGDSVMHEGLRLAGHTKASFGPVLTIVVGGPQTWYLETGTTAYVDGPLTSSGNVTLTKDGPGDLHLRGLTSGLTGTMAVNGGTLLLGSSGAFESAAVSIGADAALASTASNGTTIGTEVSLASGAKLGSAIDAGGANKLVLTGTVTAGSSVVLAEGSQTYFAGTFNGAPAHTDVTFTGGGVAVLKGTTVPVTPAASFTASGAGLVIDTIKALPTGGLQATNDGYLGMGSEFASSPATFIAKISDPANFSGTLGFDSDPSGAPNVFSGAIDLTAFIDSGFRGLGSASHANITGTITVPTGYKFGGGGGRLTVASGLSGTVGLTVASPATDPLTVVLTGTNTFTGNIGVDHSYLIFDSSGALPTGATISLGGSGYVSATASANLTPTALLARIGSSDAESILGFDSSLPASTARTVSDAITLDSFAGYLGTTTFFDTGLTLSGQISGPDGKILKLAGVNGGKLNVTSALSTANHITSVVVGHPNAELNRNGTVVLSGASDYTGGTTLQRGTLLLGSSSAGDGSTGPLGKSTGALTVKHNADGEAAVLAPAAGSASLLNDITLEADSYLRVGLDAGNLTLGGTVSGSGQLWFVGPTITTLAGASTRDGETYVKDTTVNVDANTGLASTHLFVINSTVAFGSAASAPTIGSLSGTSDSMMSFGAANTTLTINQTLESNPVIENKYAGTFSPSGTLSLVKTGGASLWLSQANTISGNVTVNEGTLGFSGNGSIGGELKVNAGSVNFGNTGTFTTGHAYIGNEAGQTGSAEIFTGSIWSSTGYVKVGAAQSANGVLSIEQGARLDAGGTLYIGHAPASSGTVNVIGPGATLSASTLVIADGGQIGGTGPFATGTLAILNGGAVTLSGGAEIRPSGTIAIGDGYSAGSFSASGGLTNDGTLNFNLGTALSFATTVEGSGVINKEGSATLTLSGNNSAFTGDLRVQAGAVDLANDHAIGTAALQIESLGAVTFSSANPSIGSLSGTAGAAITLGSSSTLTANLIDDSVYAGSIAGDGALTLRGTGSGATLTLSGANTYTGGTTLTNGSVVMAQSGQALGAAGTVNVNGGTLAVAAGQTLAFTSGTHPLVFTSGTLAGLGTYSLDTSLSIGANQSVAPGVGTLAFNLNSGSGTLTFASDGTYIWQLQDNGSVTLASSVQVAGTLDIAATPGAPFSLKLSTVGASGLPGTLANFIASDPASWTLLTTTAGITGFDSTKFAIDTTGFLNPTDSGLFSLTQNGNNLVLNFTPVPEPSTWVLMLTGLSVVALRAFRRRRQS